MSDKPLDDVVLEKLREMPDLEKRLCSAARHDPKAAVQLADQLGVDGSFFTDEHFGALFDIILYAGELKDADEDYLAPYAETESRFGLDVMEAMRRHFSPKLEWHPTTWKCIWWAESTSAGLANYLRLLKENNERLEAASRLLAHARAALRCDSDALVEFNVLAWRKRQKRREADQKLTATVREDKQTFQRRRRQQGGGHQGLPSASV
jgi:hypothetical protein